MRFIGPITWALVLVASLSCGEDEPPPPPTRLSVSVMGPTGAIAGARVLIAGLAAQKTDATGKVEVDVPEGVHGVRIEAKGFVTDPLPGDFPRVVTTPKSVTTSLEVSLWPKTDGVGSGALAGRLAAPSDGVLVVARGTIDYAALTDASGAFELEGLLPAQYKVTAYEKGFSYGEASGVAVAADGRTENVTVERLGPADGRVEGQLTGALSGTTAIGLFDLGTGEVLPGLRVYASAEAPFSIEGVPPGRFLVDAALELDDVVVDPDLVRTDTRPIVEVGTTAAQPLSLSLSPRVRGIGTRTSSAGLMLTWSPHSEADFYVVEVTDLLGATLFGGFDARRNWRARVLHPSTELPIEPANPLRAGAAYRARVFAAIDDPTRASFELVAASESREGLFVAP
ncbi:MAG: carboxypeptidase regulatory-like domain-containing protein [Deltaproteobacteria bacterium]|nr:carboxypeptidase regulatory-like domain-containing protein [Deltaproteobacteria bacterium]